MPFLTPNDTPHVAKRLAIIDPQPLYCKGIKDMIANQEHLRLVGEARTGQNGLKLVEEKQPDLVLVALKMKGNDAIETIKAIKQINDGVLVIALSESVHENNDLYVSLQAGADGCLPRQMLPEELVERLVEAAPGSIITSRSMRVSLQRILTGEVSRSENAKQVQLTGRESAILQLLTTGMCNKRIGRELGISDGTVKVHVKHLLKKLKVRNRLEAACWLKRQSAKQVIEL